MPNQYSVDQFVKAFEQVYQTIDIRAALIKDEDQWRSVCIVLRIQIAPANIIKREFQKLKTRYGKMESLRFRIIQHCYSFSELGQITDAFLKGRLMLGDVEIQLEGKIEILGLLGRIPWFSGSGDKPTIANWPVLRSQVRLSERYSFRLRASGSIASRNPASVAYKSLLRQNNPLMGQFGFIWNSDRSSSFCSCFWYHTVLKATRLSGTPSFM